MAYDPRAESIGLFKRALTKAFDFRGRSRRTEFLAYYLGSVFAAMIVLLLLQLFASKWIDFDAQSNLTSAIQLLIAIPLPSLLVRRLHDQGRSGWWVLVPAVFMLTAWGYELWTGKFLEERFYPIAWGITVITMMIAVFYMIFAPGQEGDNVYGLDPHHD